MTGGDIPHDQVIVAADEQAGVRAERPERFEIGEEVSAEHFAVGRPVLQVADVVDRPECSIRREGDSRHVAVGMEARFPEDPVDEGKWAEPGIIAEAKS